MTEPCRNYNLFRRKALCRAREMTRQALRHDADGQVIHSGRRVEGLTCRPRDAKCKTGFGRRASTSGQERAEGATVHGDSAQVTPPRAARRSGRRAHRAKQWPRATRGRSSRRVVDSTLVCQCQSSTGTENNKMPPQVSQTGRSTRRVTGREVLTDHQHGAQQEVRDVGHGGSQESRVHTIDRLKLCAGCTPGTKTDNDATTESASHDSRRVPTRGHVKVTTRGLTQDKCRDGRVLLARGVKFSEKAMECHDRRLMECQEDRTRRARTSSHSRRRLLTRRTAKERAHR